MELLVEWRARAGEPGVPKPTDAAVRRVAGNAITASTATFIGSDLLVERPKLWAAAARLNPSWAVKGACPRVAGDDRFGAAAPALPVTNRDLGMWRGGGGERAAPATPPRVNVRGGLSLVIGWLWSLAMLVAVPGAAAEARSGTLESFLVHEPFGILETRFGMSFDPHALRHTAAGGGLACRSAAAQSDGIQEAALDQLVRRLVAEDRRLLVVERSRVEEVQEVRVGHGAVGGVHYQLEP